MGLKHAPVVIQLSDKDIYRSDLMQELYVDKHNIDKELLRQAAKYGFWAALYAETSSKVEKLEMRLEEMFSDLAREYYKRPGKKVSLTEIKNLIVGESKYRKLRRHLWKWKKSERILKGAVRAFDQRLNAIQSFAANQRREKDSEPRVHKNYRGESE